MNIRKAKLDDYEYLAKLNIDLGYDYPVEKVKKNLKNILDKKIDLIYVATDENDHAIGYIHFAPYNLIYLDNLIDIIGLVVSNEHRKKGIGKELLKIAEDYGKSNGHAGVRLVSGENRIEAHKFYENCGYHNRKNQKNFIKIFN